VEVIPAPLNKARHRGIEKFKGRAHVIPCRRKDRKVRGSFPQYYKKLGLRRGNDGHWQNESGSWCKICDIRSVGVSHERMGGGGGDSET